MDEDSGDVVAFNVVQVSEVSLSNAMEKEGFSRCLQDLEEKGITIDRIATDRHVSISSSMKKDFPHINHQYDVWHLSKWVVKKLTNKAKQKGCEELAPWIQFISNHLWWCAATCDRKCAASVCFRSCSQEAQVVRQHVLPSVLPPTYLFL